MLLIYSINNSFSARRLNIKNFKNSLLGGDAVQIYRDFSVSTSVLNELSNLARFILTSFRLVPCFSIHLCIDYTMIVHRMLSPPWVSLILFPFYIQSQKKESGLGNSNTATILFKKLVIYVSKLNMNSQSLIFNFKEENSSMRKKKIMFGENPFGSNTWCKLN